MDYPQGCVKWTGRVGDPIPDGALVFDSDGRVWVPTQIGGSPANPWDIHGAYCVPAPAPPAPAETPPPEGYVMWEGNIGDPIPDDALTRTATARGWVPTVRAGVPATDGDLDWGYCVPGPEVVPTPEPPSPNPDALLTVYIATSYLDRHTLYPKIEAVCLDLGYRVTYRWPDDEAPTDWEERHKHRTEAAAKEIDGVIQADVMVLGLPGRLGAHAELGAALASCVPVVLYGVPLRNVATGDTECVFHDHPGVEYVSADLDELRADLQTIGVRKLAERMAELLYTQQRASYDSWTTGTHRAERDQVLRAYDRMST